jgi:hypothetical protein
MPYMLKSIHDRRYEHSRHSALEAARSQIRSYVRLRSFPGAEILICELMDFLAFSAGMCLVVGSLYMPGSATVDTIEDASLINALIASLKRTSELLDCRVASQSALVLELLTDPTRQGEGPVEVAVPYFGVMKINAPGAASPALSADSSIVSGGSYSTLFTPEGMGSVQFNTDELASGFPLVFYQGDELAADWFAAMDIDQSYWQIPQLR